MILNRSFFESQGLAADAKYHEHVAKVWAAIDANDKVTAWRELAKARSWLDCREYWTQQAKEAAS